MKNNLNLSTAFEKFSMMADFDYRVTMRDTKPLLQKEKEDCE